jgi:hypothetical protein
MQALHSSGTGEVELSGTRAELAALAGLLDAGEGELALAAVDDPRPYDAAVERLVVKADEQALAKVDVGAGAAELTFVGGLESLGLIGENLASFAAESTGGSDHLHLEHYEDHFYLASGSTPLVVALVD